MHVYFFPLMEQNTNEPWDHQPVTWASRAARQSCGSDLPVGNSQTPASLIQQEASRSEPAWERFLNR